jgi:hypothetical protein
MRLPKPALAAAAPLLAVLLVSPSHAFLEGAYPWGFGPLAGVNLSGADLGGPEDRGIMGWALGGRLELGVNRLLSVSTDPMLIRSGAEFDPSDEDFEARGQFYLMEVPMFIKARTSLFNVGVYAFAGPNAVFVYDQSGQLDAGHAMVDESSRVGLSGDIGLGSSFGVAPMVDVTADARYSHGFTDLIDHGVGEVDSWRSRDVRFVLGVLIHGG